MGKEGIILIDKPIGWSSHDCVAKMRRFLKVKRVGHTGTLDPLASGLLVLLIGKATKLLQFLDQNHKEYIASVCLGTSTDTLDREGKVIEKRQIPTISTNQMERTCREFEGEILQMPPAFSAIKTGGRKFYELARAGRKVPLKPRKVEIKKIEMLNWEPPFLKIQVACRKGTYIRSLAKDIGEKLGCGAHLASLRRIKSGKFSLKEALSMDQLRNGELRIIAVDTALKEIPALFLGPEANYKFKNGSEVTLSDHFNGQGKSNKVRVKTKDKGKLSGIGKFDPSEKTLHPLRVL